MDGIQADLLPALPGGIDYLSALPMETLENIAHFLADPEVTNSKTRCASFVDVGNLRLAGRKVASKLDTFFGHAFVAVPVKLDFTGLHKLENISTSHYANQVQGLRFELPASVVEIEDHYSAKVDERLKFRADEVEDDNCRQRARSCIAMGIFIGAEAMARIPPILMRLAKLQEVQLPIIERDGYEFNNLSYIHSDICEFLLSQLEFMTAPLRNLCFADKFNIWSSVGPSRRIWEDTFMMKGLKKFDEIGDGSRARGLPERRYSSRLGGLPLLQDLCVHGNFVSPMYIDEAKVAAAFDTWPPGIRKIRLNGLTLLEGKYVNTMNWPATLQDLTLENCNIAAYGFVDSIMSRFSNLERLRVFQVADDGRRVAFPTFKSTNMTGLLSLQDAEGTNEAVASSGDVEGGGVVVSFNPYEIRIDSKFDNIGEKLKRLKQCWTVTAKSRRSDSRDSYWWDPKTPLTT